MCAIPPKFTMRQLKSVNAPPVSLTSQSMVVLIVMPQAIGTKHQINVKCAKDKLFLTWLPKLVKNVLNLNPSLTMEYVYLVQQTPTTQQLAKFVSNAPMELPLTLQPLNV